MIRITRLNVYVYMYMYTEDILNVMVYIWAQENTLGLFKTCVDMVYIHM